MSPRLCTLLLIIFSLINVHSTAADHSAASYPDGTKSDQIKDEGAFYIQSALSYGKDLKGYIDVPGTTQPAHGSNLWVYHLSDLNEDLLFRIIPSHSNILFYSIAVAENISLLVDAGSSASPAGAPIGLRSANNSESQNFFFIHQGGGRFKIYNQSGRVITLANRSAESSSKIITANDEPGLWTEWYLIEAAANKPYIPEEQTKDTPDITSININKEFDQETILLASDIDNLYGSLLPAETKSSALIRVFLLSGNALAEARSASLQPVPLSTRINSLNKSLLPFAKFLFIGETITLFSSSVTAQAAQLVQIDASLTTIRNTIIEPSAADLQTALRRNILLNSQLRFLKQYLYSVKQNLSALSKEEAAAAKKDFAALRQRIAALNSSLPALMNYLSDTEKNCASVSVIINPALAFYTGISAIDISLKGLDKIADDINKILNKRFKQELSGVTIDITLRGVLEGGTYNEIFKKEIEDFIHQEFAAVISILTMPFPAAPGSDHFKETLTANAEVTKKMRLNSSFVDEISPKITAIVSFTPAPKPN